MKNFLEMHELVIINPAKKGEKGEVIMTVSRFAESISAAVKQTRHELSFDEISKKYLVLQKAAISGLDFVLADSATLSDIPARGRRWANPRTDKTVSLSFA